MNYRVLGRTGLKVSELGIGGHEYLRFPHPRHFPVKRKVGEEISPEELSTSQDPRTKLIEHAIDAGVNYFDTTFVEECQSLGLALKRLGKRNSVHIAAEILHPLRKLTENPKVTTRDFILQGVERILRLLQTDYIDIFNLHLPGEQYSREKFETILPVLREIKDQGKIGAAGASSHNPRFLAKLIKRYDCFDSIMVLFNYHLNEAPQVLFPLCKVLDIGVVAMKPFAWPYYGVPFTHFCQTDLESARYTLAQVNFRWILESPEVSTVVAGMNTEEELEENLTAFAKEGKIDEGILERCLKTALSSTGRKMLGKLSKGKGIAGKRVDVQGFSKRALEKGPMSTGSSIR